ncbi:MULTISPECIES: hypothetical protein [Bacillaceae]|uniref:Uncharacterized protein n=1 Tax=Evansella alkalicola TaxID=745819 RepID=A0ABS6JY66_9BACI|nr:MULTISPECIES: hypothetical protein [Bacillaceae]MBU9723530.1 hypothetical protein [Bacillus alkalicola]
MNRFLRNILLLLFIVFILHVTTSWIIRGIHYTLFQSHQYVTYVIPMLHLTKYFAIAMLLLIILRKYAILTPAGNILTFTGLVISITMLVTTSLWSHGANQEQIMRHRIILHQTISWDEVEKVSTEIKQKSRHGTFRTTKVIGEYNLHLEDGSVINIWSDVSSIYDLHQFVTGKGIQVEYLTNNIQNFDQNYTYYFKNSLEKAHQIFGVEQ